MPKCNIWSAFVIRVDGEVDPFTRNDRMLYETNFTVLFVV